MRWVGIAYRVERFRTWIHGLVVVRGPYREEECLVSLEPLPPHHDRLDGGPADPGRRAAVAQALLHHLGDLERAIGHGVPHPGLRGQNRHHPSELVLRRLVTREDERGDETLHLEGA